MVGLFFNRRSKSDRGASEPPADFEATAPALYDPRLADYEDTTPDALPGMPDLYAVIGVDPRASDDTIRYAYRQRAARLLDARWRPGRAARRLAGLNAAYEILGKPDRRADYDRQRMRQAAYERAQLAAPRADSFETTAYHPVDETSNGETGGFEAGEVPADGAFRDGNVQASPPFRDGPFHDGPTLVGVEGAAPVARPVGVASPASRRAFRLTRPTSPRDAAILVAAALLALAVVAGLVGVARSFDASSVAALGSGIGYNPMRAAPTATAPPAPTPTARPVLIQQPTATLPARPTVAANPNAASGPGAIGTQVRISDQNPPRFSDLGVTVRVTRDGRPLPNVPVALRVYYEMVEERWPPGEEVVLTNATGEATIVFNVGSANPGYEAQVVAVADVGGEPFQMQTSFVPR